MIGITIKFLVNIQIVFGYFMLQLRNCVIPKFDFFAVFLSLKFFFKTQVRDFHCCAVLLNGDVFERFFNRVEKYSSLIWEWSRLKKEIRHIAAATCFSSLVSMGAIADDSCYDFQISQNNVDVTLVAIAQLTKNPLLLSYDQVKSIKANSVKGCFTLKNALEIALKGTGLEAKISEQGIIAVKFAKKNSTTLEGRKVKKSTSITRTRKALMASTAVALALGSYGVQAQDAADDTDSVEEIVVTGIRGSLESAAAIKRSANQMVDAISAEDIGLFSDNNISEALARIPGVQLERDEQGEGYRVSIRGLGPRFVRSTINGRTALSSPAGSDGTGARGFSFGIIPSEVIGRADVVKSPRAIDVEGGIGGVVNLETTRPLDFANKRDKDLHVTGAVRGSYNTYSKYATPRGSLFVNKRINDSLAVFGAMSYEDIKTRTDSVDMNRAGPHRIRLYEGSLLNGETVGVGTSIGGNEYDEDDGYIQFRAGTLDQTRNRRSEKGNERITFTGGAQWQPTDNLDIYVDWTHGREDKTSRDTRIQIFNDNILRFTDLTYSPTRVSSITVNTEDAHVRENGQEIVGMVTAYDFQNFARRNNRGWASSGILDVPGKSTINVGGIDAEWTDNEGFTATLNVGYASHKGQSNQRGFGYDLDNSAVNDPMYVATPDRERDENNDWVCICNDTQGTSGSYYLDPVSGVPIFNFFSALNGEAFDPTSTDQYVMSRERHLATFEDSEEKSVRLDLEKEIYDGFIKKLYIGASWRDKDGDRNRIDTDFKPANSGGGDHQDLGFEDIPTILYDNFLTNLDVADYPYATFATPSVEEVVAADRTGVFGADVLTEGKPEYGHSYTFAEEIIAGYMMMDFANPDVKFPFRGNFGVRIAHTKQFVSGRAGLRDADIEDTILVSTNREYTNILPSANIAFDLRDDLVLRFAGGRALTRPDPSNMRGTLEYRFDQHTVKAGNPDLAPYETNNFDASLEWYPETGGSYAIGVFHKQLLGYITTLKSDVTEDFSRDFFIDPDTGELWEDLEDDPVFEYDQPVNTEGGTIQGFEITGHQPFDAFTDGFLQYFGISANVTHVKADLKAKVGNTALPLRGQSKWSGNIVGYYERDDWSVRVAYSKRSAYLHQEAADDGQYNEFNEGFDNLDLNASYKISKQLRLRLSAQNLTNTKGRSSYYQMPTNQYFSEFRNNGRRFSLELRFTM